MSRWTNNRTPLATMRSNAGLSRAQAAVWLGLGVNTLGRYETGQSDLPFGIAEQMVRLYGASFEEIRSAVRKTKEAVGVQIKGRPRKLCSHLDNPNAEEESTTEQASALEQLTMVGKASIKNSVDKT